MTAASETMSVSQDGTSVRTFSLLRVTICLLPLLALVLWIVALATLATAGDTATASTPARLTVPIPEQAARANAAMLELSVRVSGTDGPAHLGALVRFKGEGMPGVEVGRLSITGREQSYQFNVSRALGGTSGGSAEIEVSLINRGGGEVPANAALTVGRAEIVVR